KREPRILATNPGTSCTMTISRSATFGALCSRQTFLRWAWPIVRAARPAWCRVPDLNIEPGELLQGLGAGMSHDLGFRKLAIALRRACGDAARRGLPLVNTGPHEVGSRDLGRLDIGAAVCRGDQLGELDLRLALGALERLVGDLTLAGT